MDETTGRADVLDTEVEGLADTKPEPMIDPTLIEENMQQVPMLRAAQLSDVGAIRKRNEDSCLVFSSESGGHFPLMPFGLYIVADGMGGHESGHLASKGASRAAANHILEEVYLPLLTADDPPAKDVIEKIMEDAVQTAHEAIYNPDPAKDGGTTLTMALIIGQDLHVAHVGDSRAYCLVDGNLKAISTDHSLVQRMQDEGQLTAEEAQHYQYRNVLLRALGQENKLEVDTYHYSLPSSGKLLLCSDGLCGLVMDPDLQKIMNQTISPHRIVKQLIAAAMKAGGYDNITAVVVEFSY
ncbi:MAG: protein phosphatase 2C domain-containing protein [Candidatus Promineifilaceae bacterium]|nr:protein phosphatase 2C domain-containing protein [Candidatus Promineifilaceae bacterium]